MPDIRIPNGVITVAGKFKSGDPAPAGYLDWHEWAEAQHKSGLRQSECGECAKWFYPQELSGKYVEVKGRTPKLIEVTYKMCVCKECDAAMGRGEGGS